MTLTDLAIDRLRDNVRRNAGAVGGARLSVRRLVWGDEGDLAALERTRREEGGGIGGEKGEGDFDLVVGSDLLYNPDSFPALVRTLRGLAGRSGGVPVCLSYAPRNLGEPAFFELAEGEGMTFRAERIGDRGQAVLATGALLAGEEEAPASTPEEEADLLWDTDRY